MSEAKKKPENTNRKLTEDDGMACLLARGTLQIGKLRYIITGAAGGSRCR